MGINTELLNSLEDTQLVNAIGELYNLGDDATPMLADHLEEMQDVQDRTQALIEATKDLYKAYQEVSAQLKAQKDANVKLMYDATKRGLKSKTDEQSEIEKADRELDDALGSIELESEDDQHGSIEIS